MTADEAPTTECSTCGKAWPGDVKFCGECGSPLQASHALLTGSAGATLSTDATAAGTASVDVPAEPASGPPNGQRAISISTGSGASVDLGRVLGAVAALGVGIGSAVTWTSGVSVNAFEIALFPLFDSTSTDFDLKVGVPLVILAVIALICALVPRAGIGLLLCGALALVPTIAYVARVGESIERSGRSWANVTEVLGAGVWITGVSAIALILVPLFDPRQPISQALRGSAGRKSA